MTIKLYHHSKTLINSFGLYYLRISLQFRGNMSKTWSNLICRKNDDFN